MVFKFGVVYEFPVATMVLPNGVVYHVKFPAGGLPIAEALKVTLPLPQMVSFAAMIS